jgi:hypothetical protein
MTEIGLELLQGCLLGRDLVLEDVFQALVGDEDGVEDGVLVLKVMLVVV